jgi:predicted DNA-binding protein
VTKITIPEDLIHRLRANALDECDEAVARIEALEAALDEIIMEATSRNHAIDIARRARHGDDKKISPDAK